MSSCRISVPGSSAAIGFTAPTSDLAIDHRDDVSWAPDGLVQREGPGPKHQVAARKEALDQTGGDLMIVGHLPFLGKLVALLVTGSGKNEIAEFRFGGVVCVECRDDKK